MYVSEIEIDNKKAEIVFLWVITFFFSGLTIWIATLNIWRFYIRESQIDLLYDNIYEQKQTNKQTDKPEERLSLSNIE